MGKLDGLNKTLKVLGRELQSGFFEVGLSFIFFEEQVGKNPWDVDLDCSSFDQLGNVLDAKRNVRVIEERYFIIDAILSISSPKRLTVDTNACIFGFVDGHGVTALPHFTKDGHRSFFIEHGANLTLCLSVLLHTHVECLLRSLRIPERLEPASSEYSTTSCQDSLGIRVGWLIKVTNHLVDQGCFDFFIRDGFALLPCFSLV